jgi:hypothetical protein
MTLKQYIQNPAGTKASVISNRKMYEDLYRDKWGKIMTRENGHLDYALYIDKTKYIAHIKIPSEQIEDFYYDIVFVFDHPGTIVSKLDDCETLFFSNDPSFNYTFAHAFKKHKMTIKELEGKMAKVALKKSPKEKNPDDVIGYVKTFYFAYIFLSEKGLLNKARFKAEAKPINWRVFNKLIEQTEDKIEARQKAGLELEKKKKKAKEDEPKLRKEDVKHPEAGTQSFFLGHTKRISNIGHVDSAKKTVPIKKNKSAIHKVKRR